MTKYGVRSKKEYGLSPINRPTSVSDVPGVGPKLTTRFAKRGLTSLSAIAKGKKKKWDALTVPGMGPVLKARIWKYANSYGRKKKIDAAKYLDEAAKKYRKKK